MHFIEFLYKIYKVIYKRSLKCKPVQQQIQCSSALYYFGLKINAYEAGPWFSIMQTVDYPNSCGDCSIRVFCQKLYFHINFVTGVCFIEVMQQRSSAVYGVYESNDFRYLNKFTLICIKQLQWTVTQFSYLRYIDYCYQSSFRRAFLQKSFSTDWCFVVVMLDAFRKTSTYW